MSRPAGARLLLDEMFSPAIAASLRDLGHDVVGVAEGSELRAMTDEEVFVWAGGEARWLLTENVKDFRPILLRALQAGPAHTGILYASSRTFPRSRKNHWPADKGALCLAAGRAARRPPYGGLAAGPYAPWLTGAKIADPAVTGVTADTPSAAVGGDKPTQPRLILDYLLQPFLLSFLELENGFS